MKKVLLLAVVVLIAAAMPASAYVYNWSDGFESYAKGGLWGQGPWVNSGGTSNTNFTVQDTLVFAGNKAATQGTGAAKISQSTADLRYLNSNGSTYKKGYAKFWVYDPGNVVNQTDGRVGIVSKGSPTPGGDSVSEIFSAQVQTNNATMNWEAQWSWSAVMMDGVSAPSGAGYQFTAGPAAERVVGAWSYVMITWSFTYGAPDMSVGSGTIKWYVNQTSVNPNLTLNFNNTAGARWAPSNNIAGVVIGALYQNSTPMSYDNIEFHADAVPEPSSLLALGTGMVGLLGLIRRRK